MIKAREHDSAVVLTEKSRGSSVKTRDTPITTRRPVLPLDRPRFLEQGSSDASAKLGPGSPTDPLNRLPAREALPA